MEQNLRQDRTHKKFIQLTENHKRGDMSRVGVGSGMPKKNRKYTDTHQEAHWRNDRKREIENDEEQKKEVSG